MIAVDELEQMLPPSGGPNYFDTWDRHHSIAFTTATKGLHNAPGENNCFVNSAVQVFWHLDVFRRSYRRLSGHTCMGNSCIFCALKVIFTQFQFSDQTSLHPDALRKALAETFVNQQRFQLGHMDDAAECFENILRRIHFHIASNHSEDSCNIPHCLPHQKFALNIVEKVACSCGGSSNPLKFTEMVHYISATALVSQARVLQQTGDTLHPDRFGLLLRNANALGDMRDCPKACGKRVQICRTLLNSPDVVSIGLVWDSDHPSVEMTTEVARNIGTTILLQDVFHSVMQDVRSLPRLQLVGLVCYYGKHYSTFVFHSKLQVWIYFDDATVREIGKSWEDVVEKCSRGRYQPLLLLYANPNAVPVPVDTAPKKRTMARGFDPTGEMDGLNKSQESISSQYVGQRPQTPNLESTTSHKTQLLPPRSRSVTPSESGTSESFVRAAEHSRQQSFIMAVSSKADDMKAKIPLRLGGQASSKVNLPGPMVPPSAPTSTHENSHYSKYTLLSSSQCKQPSVEDFDPVRVTIPPSFKSQDRRDVNRKEPTRVDIVRYPEFPSTSQISNFLPPERSGYNHSDQPAGKIQNFPSHNSKTQVLTSDVGYTNPAQKSVPFDVGDNTMDRSQEHFHHTVVKPHAATQQIYEQGHSMFQSHTPVQSGLATLPRKKKEIPRDLHSHQNENKGVIGKSASVEHFNNGLEQRATALMAVKPPLVAVKQRNNPVEDTTESDKRMKKPIIKPEQKLKSELSRSQPNLWKESQSLQLCDSGSTRYSAEESHTKENMTYIDRKMVESILNHQGLKRNTSALSTSSISTSDSGVMGKPVAGRSGPGSQNTDTSFDNVSLGSHKDSGYGSSDRNSSSSTGSGSVDPYVQYFISKSMVVPRSVNPQFLSQMGNDALNQRQQTSSSGVHGNRHTLSRQEINQHLSETFAQRQVMHPIKESSLEEILKEAPQGQPTPVSVVSPSPTPYSLNAEGKPLTAPPKNLAAFQVSKSSHHKEPSIDSLDKDEVENAYFVSMCEKADDLMDSCIIAETKGELTEALRYCDSALGCLKEAMNQTDISNTALVYAQKKHNACLLKSRSLFKRTSSSQEGKRSSITSSDSDNSERPLRKIASKERLLGIGRGTLAQCISSQTASTGKLPTSVSQQALTFKEGQPVCAPGGVQVAPFKSEFQSQVQPHPARGHVSRNSVMDRSDSESTHSRSGSNSSARSSGSALSVTQQDPYQNAGRLSTEATMGTNVSMHVPLDNYGTLPRNRQPRRTSDPTGSSDVYKSYLNRQKHAADSSKNSCTQPYVKDSSEPQDSNVIHRLTSLNASDSQQSVYDTLPAKTRNLTTDVKFQEQKHFNGRVGSAGFSAEDKDIMYSESSYTTGSNASCSTPMVSSTQQTSLSSASRLTLSQPGHNSIVLQAVGHPHRSDHSDPTFRNGKSLSVSSNLTCASLVPAACQQQTTSTSVQNVSKRGHPPPPPPARTSSDPESCYQLPESEKYQQQQQGLGGPTDSQPSACRLPARTGKQKIVAQVQPNNHIDGSRRPTSSESAGSTRIQLPHSSSSLGLYNSSYKSLVQPGVTEGQGWEDPSSYYIQGSSLVPNPRLSYHTGATTEFHLKGETFASVSQTLNPTIAQVDGNVSAQPMSENILHENSQQPSVKDLASRFSKLLHKPAVKPKPPALSKPRTRSKSESVSIKPKSVLKTKKNKTSKSLRKSVTFAKDISNYAAGYESAGELRPKWVNEEASQRAFYSDDDDGGGDDDGIDDADDDRVHTSTATNLSNDDLDDGVEDSSTSDDGPGGREDQVCHLCRKREVNGGKFYCTKCSFYMNRLVQP